MTRVCLSALALAVAVTAGVCGASAPASASVYAAPSGAIMKPALTIRVPARFGGDSFAGAAADRDGQVSGIILVHGGGGHGAGGHGAGGRGHGHGGLDNGYRGAGPGAPPWPSGQPVSGAASVGQPGMGTVIPRGQD